MPDTSTYPLTTIFTPPSSCLAPTYTYYSGHQFGVDYDNVTGTSVYRAYQPQCFPANFTTYYTTTTSYPGTQATYYDESVIITTAVYSPGVCPSGYAPAVTVIQPTGTITRATCCPSGFSIIQDGGLASDCRASDQTLVITGDIRTSTFVPSVFATPVVIEYAASDLSLLPGYTQSTTAAPAPSTNNPSSSNSQLSTGAQAGIGVGVSFAVLLVAGVILALFMRRKRRGNKQEIKGEYAHEKAELPGDGKERPELGGEAARYEADDKSRPHEAASEVRAELEGDWRGYELPSAHRQGCAA